jgi:hypothetical protein
MKQSSAFIKLDSKVTPDYVQELLDNGSLYSAYTVLEVSDKLLLRYIEQYNLTYTKAFRTVRDLTEIEKNNIVYDWCNTNLTKRDIAKKYKLGSKALNRFINQNKLQSRDKVQSDPKLLQYQKLVRRLTAVVIRHYNLKTVPGFDWDHKFSVYEGFKQNIHPNIIASRDNLELILISENRSNGRKCSITRDELLNSVCYSSP